MKKRTYKRRKMIMGGFQYRLLAIYASHFVIILLIFICTVFLPLMIKLGSENIPSLEREVLADQFLTLHYRLWPAVAVVLVLILIHSVIISHRITGPIFRIRKELTSVGAGDLSSRIVLRKNDYLKKEAAMLNDMKDSLSEKIISIENDRRSADLIISDLLVFADKSSRDEIKQKLEELSSRIADVKKGLDQFTVRAQRSDQTPDNKHIDLVNCTS